MLHKLNTTLYHGTISDISKIDVTQGRGRKDFGRGFYMSVTKQQAVGMMHKKYREAIRRSRTKSEAEFTERLYQITLNEKLLETLNIKVFETADDDTAFCLKAYWDGLYGRTGSAEAKNILLHNLETDNLGIQYFIGKQEVANALILELLPIEWR